MINILQIILNALVVGSIYSLVSSGFSLIYNTNKFIHFAHGAVISFSAYILWFFFSLLNLELFLSIVLSLVFAGFLGWALNRFIYRNFRKRGTSGNIFLIVSFGILMFLESLIQILFGPGVKLIKFDFLSGMFLFFGARITVLQIATILSSFLILILLLTFLRRSKLGKAMRAVSDSKEVAEIVGIDSEKIYSLSFILGSIIAGIAGIFIALNQALSVQMGTNFIIKGFAAMIIGGIGSIYGSIFGSFFLGIIENFTVVVLSSQFKDAISFLIVILFLLFRPKGILGIKKEKDKE